MKVFWNEILLCERLVENSVQKFSPLNEKKVFCLREPHVLYSVGSFRVQVCRTTRDICECIKDKMFLQQQNVSAVSTAAQRPTVFSFATDLLISALDSNRCRWVCVGSVFVQMFDFRLQVSRSCRFPDFSSAGGRSRVGDLPSQVTVRAAKQK